MDVRILCTFCDWGSATFTKMRRFSEETLMKELDWFAENKMTYIDCCDANFGIFFVRDLRIAKKLNELSTTKGFPQTFQQSWAKKFIGKNYTNSKRTAKRWSTYCSNTFSSITR